MSAYAEMAMRLASRKLASNYLTAPGVLYPAGLAIHSTPEQFKTTNRFVGRLNGETFGKAATTALTFTAAHVVTASKHGIILVQVTPAGTVSTKVPAATPTTAMAYDTAALALAALPAADAGNVAMGYIAIANNAGDWTGNTDDLTAASDVTTATFTDYPAMTFLTT
jgi:hypothetical protein